MKIINFKHPLLKLHIKFYFFKNFDFILYSSFQIIFINILYVNFFYFQFIHFSLKIFWILNLFIIYDYCIFNYDLMLNWNQVRITIYLY